MNKLRQLILESIGDYIREIDETGNMAALEAKIGKTQEAIELREKKMNMNGLDEAYHDMLDKGKIKELGGEVKALKKSLVKLEKQLEKLKSKSDKSPKIEDTEEKEIVDENNFQLEETTDTDIYEILHMQKLAGIISETEYVAKINEVEKKKASADMTKKEKSAVVKKARAGKDVDRKKPKSLKEQVKALFEGGYDEYTDNSIKEWLKDLIDGKIEPNNDYYNLSFGLFSSYPHIVINFEEGSAKRKYITIIDTSKDEANGGKILGRFPMMESYDDVEELYKNFMLWFKDKIKQ